MSNIRKLRITVEGKTYDVEVEALDEGGTAGVAAPPMQTAPAVAPIIASPQAGAVSPQAGLSGGAASAEAPGEVRAAVAGKVSQVHVKMGDAVHVNDKLVTLEAMKMFVDVCAPASGKVTEVLCAPGDAVTDGAVLVKLA